MIEIVPVLIVFLYITLCRWFSSEVVKDDIELVILLMPVFILALPILLIKETYTYIGNKYKS